MYKHSFMETDANGHLIVGGCDMVSVAEEYQTPIYVMDEGRIRSNMRAYKNSIDEFYDGNGLCLYASKAFSAVCMYKIAAEEGLGVDVVSGGELYTAIKAGFDTSKIVFHGSNKSTPELEMAIESGVGRIIVDGEGEIERIDSISKQKGKITNIMIRVKPGVDAHTHEFISTGHIDCKFGFSIENGEAFEFIKKASAFENVCIKGLHCHIGSQIFLFEPFKCAAEIMMNFYAELNEKLGLSFDELNLGGGFGIKYVENDTPVSYGGYIGAVSDIIKNICAQKSLKVPFIYMEPGRSIVGDAGITLYTVGTIKDIPGVRKYVSVDGGMADNPRSILYGAQYDAVFANRAHDLPTEKVTVCGKCCESGDIIIKDGYLPKAETGDVLAVMSTGAYNYSMASNYNRIPRPPVVMVDGGKSRLVVKRESYEDITRLDVE